LKLLEILFGSLLISILLTQLSFWGLLETGHTSYILALLICTGATIYISYNLYLLKTDHKPVQKEYSFYYIIGNPPSPDLFDRNIRNRM